MKVRVSTNVDCIIGPIECSVEVDIYGDGGAAPDFATYEAMVETLSSVAKRAAARQRDELEELAGL